MAKLGYTWYPKDWGNSESVFELSLSERGLYREFIDLAMLNDNSTEIKKDVWIRKFCVSKEDLDFILCKLVTLNLIEFRENILFIPSCESRLKLVRGGSNGGKKSKPTSKPDSKPITKPFKSLDAKNTKPIPKQIETKIEIENKDKTEVISKVFLKDSEIDLLKMRFKENYDEALNILSNYKNSKGVEYDSDYHAMLSWVKARIEENIIKNKIDKPKGGRVLE